VPAVRARDVPGVPIMEMRDLAFLLALISTKKLIEREGSMALDLPKKLLPKKSISITQSRTRVCHIFSRRSLTRFYSSDKAKSAFNDFVAVLSEAVSA
jgi:hypothetical protein